MKTAILLYDRFTALDVVGPFDVLSRVPGAEVTLVAERTGPVTNEVGSLSIVATATLAEVTDPDIVVIPGGPGQSAQMSDGPVHEWVRAVDATSTWTTSVCTGSLILAAVGLLAGRRATSHWLARDILRDHGADPTGERVVIDGKYVTSAGVSSGIDMALALVGRSVAPEVAQTIQLGIEYDPQPPYDAGAPEKAPQFSVDYLRSQSRFILGTD
jgi:putative intracellular protease/amidase